MTALTEQRSSAGLPAHLPSSIDHELRVCVTRLIPPISASLNRYSIAAADAPSEATRRALSERQNDLYSWLVPAGPEHANAVYDELVRTMATPAISAEDAPKELETFLRATAPLPLFALRAAKDAFIGGAIGDGKWMPRPGQICIEAQKIAAPWAKERREIHAVLTADISVSAPDPNRKAQLLAAARDMVGGMRAAAEGAKRGRMTPEEIADAKALSDAITQGRADPRPMPQLSPYLRDKLGLVDTALDATDREDAA